MRINDNGYLEIQYGKHKKPKYRNWWLIKSFKNGSSWGCQLILPGKINLPQKYFGKKIRFKCEIIEVRK